jgi:hypothetical protein
MSDHNNKVSHYENHPRAAELHNAATHNYRVGEQHGKQDHLTGHEQSRQAQEHSTDGHHPQAGGHVHAEFGHAEIAARAFELWKARGCPSGSPQEDWFHAVEELKSRSGSR